MGEGGVIIMNDSEKIALLKEHARNERYKKEPIANALISVLVKKGIISQDERREILYEFDQYMDDQIDIFFDNLNEDYNPLEQGD